MMSEARRSNLVQCEETWGYVPAYFSGIARRCHAVYCNVGVGYALQPVAVSARISAGGET
ncbi:MAG: hypothetical protein PCALPYG88_5128 [uncultured Paraburkholderia sp.]|jgi:hypothetical protein|nr:MAG: hypothetical protein PCALPYG08_5246 [uncultured Paraburkholderia sp.]CAH2933598.1 MAG: hypothetical protein PCALPYG88_5128 [uncultured Paraburkholderia sp.]